MDSGRDTLSTGRASRALTVVDTCTRQGRVSEALAVEVDAGLTGERVAQLRDRLGAERGRPRAVTCGHGPGCRGRALDVWAAARGVALGCIRPGKPADNACAGSFNGRLRDECLDSHWRPGLADARRTIGRRRVAYNTARPRRARGHRPPAADAAEFAATRHPELPADNRA
jgi:putative transposase